MKFKDENNQVHDPEMDEVNGLEFLQKRHPHKTFTPITDEDAVILLTPIPPTPAEIEVDKDARSTELLEPKKAFAAVLEVLWDSSAELQAAYPDPGGYNKMKADVIARYRAKL